MASFNLDIVTPAGHIYNEPVVSLTAPGKDGYFGVLANHAPMIAEISRGVVTVKSEEETAYFAVVGGVLEVSAEGVVMLADLAHETESLEEAKEMASSAMKTDEEA